LVKVVTERLPARGFQDIQVLAPTRRGPLGTEGLNKLLQAALNADAPGLTRGDREYRVNDRVICTRNRYDVEVFNGDIGWVRSIEGGVLSIDFDGRLISWTRDDLGLLDLAYAITVHKSQGSEYEAVVLALHRSHGIMLRRNLFYTGLTRARSFLCVIGDARAWGRAVNQTGGDERHTSLSERLRAAESTDDLSRSPWPPGPHR
jgi:exodeoxyribonuclease V alpha subunit